MSMDAVEEALLFWNIVEESLVELHGWDRNAAHERVLRLRGRMTKAAIAQDVTYHSQPFHVASDIAHGRAVPVTNAMVRRYLAVAKRVTEQRSQMQNPADAVLTKPRTSASRKSHPVAALTR
jgi:hypothetical protein